MVGRGRGEMEVGGKGRREERRIREEFPPPPCMLQGKGCRSCLLPLLLPLLPLAPPSKGARKAKASSLLHPPP